MAEKTFKWLRDTCYTRAGILLEKGKTYPVKIASPEVIAEWEKTGAIQVETKKKE